MPNSARELLPLIQPATKALAQVLAGRASGSGQLAHAQAVATQADRLIAERAHNRLNPAEREEFFEQVARLKLTLADAEDEAGVQAEEEVAKPAPRPPVDQERLKEMALALTTPDRSKAATAPANGADDQADARTTEGAAESDEASVSRASERPEREASAERGEAEPRPEARSLANAHSGRLQLSRSAAERAASAVSAAPRTRPGSARSTRARSAAGEASAERSDEAGEPAGAPAPRAEVTTAAGRADADEGGAGNGERPSRAPRRPKQKGLPDGWVIDEEGYVVPGP